MKKILGVIPARGGSKGIPGKNCKELAGKPLIAWTIDEALKCPFLDRVIVSTDDEKIAGIARANGAEVPFIRPPEFASDDATSFDVVNHAIGWLKDEEAYSPEYMLLLQPTSPLRSAEDIGTAITLMKNRCTSAVVSVCEVLTHPFTVKRIRDDGTLEDFFKNVPKFTRRQELPRLYAVNGALYLNQVDSLLKTRTFIPEDAVAYIMPAERSVDIDTPWDFRLAEFMLNRQ